MKQSLNTKSIWDIAEPLEIVNRNNIPKLFISILITLMALSPILNVH